jgi:hypothetical protein
MKPKNNDNTSFEDFENALVAVVTSKALMNLLSNNKGVIVDLATELKGANLKDVKFLVYKFENEVGFTPYFGPDKNGTIINKVTEDMLTMEIDLD